MQIGIRAEMNEALIVRIVRLFQLISGLGARRSRHHVDDAIIIVAEVAQKGRQHGRGLRFGVVEQDDPLAKKTDRREMLAVMLHGDDAAFNMGLKSVAQCALVSLEMLQVIFNVRFEVLGVNAAMLELRRGL